jgi:hypothetical protein
VTGSDAGEATADTSTDEIAVSLEPAAATSAVIVETELEEIEWTSSAGAPTAGDSAATDSTMGDDAAGAEASTTGATIADSMKGVGAAADSRIGDSTTGDWVAVTSGIGTAVFCATDVDWTGREILSIDEVTPPPVAAPADTKDGEAPTCLVDLNVYRTTAAPVPATKRMVSTCSKTMFPDTPHDR